MSLHNESRLAFRIDELIKANIRLQKWVMSFEEKAEIYEHALLEIRDNEQVEVLEVATRALKAGKLVSRFATSKASKSGSDLAVDLQPSD